MKPRAQLPRMGFTLFEVAISLVILTFGVLTLMILFPSGLKAQQLSRFQIYASVKAVEMIDAFSSVQTNNPMMDTEGPNPWDASGSYRSMAPDLETRIASYRFGLFPLPLELARRLDSDGDEIQQILGEGGYVYYSQPLATTGFNEAGGASSYPNEAQKVICTVTGYAQQNAIPMLNYKDWPYIIPYPSPPLFGTHADEQKTQTTWAFKSGSQMLWEDTTDKHIGILFKAIVKGDTLPIITKWVNDPQVAMAGLRRHVGYWSYAETGDPADKNGGWILNGGTQAGIDGEKTGVIDAMLPPTPTSPTALPNPIYEGILAAGVKTTREACAKESALAYFALAKWYAKRHELGDSLINGAALPDDSTLFSDATKNNLAKLHTAVNAARFLAHAAMCVSRQGNLTVSGPATVGELEIIRESPDSPVEGPENKTPPFTLTDTLVNTYHENCMKLVMRYAASYPYDWGAPRPTNRTIMMDFPLVQYDPFGGNVPASTLYPSYNYGSRTVDGTMQAPRQWKITSAQPITNIGRSFTFPNQNLEALQPVISTATTNPQHFTLARPFKPSDRCRQIVFWAVDWQSYEDFETAPSAPVDASRYPKKAPIGGRSNPLNLMDMPFLDWQQFGFRNPEKVLAFREPSATRPTGDMITIGGVDNVAVHDNGSGTTQRMIFSGQYGADRNANGNMTPAGGNMYGKLDRGPVPKSTRLRAVTVARFNYYDPRLTLVIR